jgi:hypothetical protein
MKKQLLLSILTVGLMSGYTQAVDVDVDALIQAIKEQDGDKFLNLYIARESDDSDYYVDVPLDPSDSYVNSDYSVDTDNYFVNPDNFDSSSVVSDDYGMSPCPFCDSDNSSVDSDSSSVDSVSSLDSDDSDHSSVNSCDSCADSDDVYYLEILQKIVDSGVDLETKLKYVDTTTGKQHIFRPFDALLMLSAFEGSFKEAKFLIDHGANVNFVDPTDGFTALRWAKKNNDQKMINLLLEHGAVI